MTAETITAAKASARRSSAMRPKPGHIFTFGYGSNMCVGRLRCRVPTACPVGVGELREYKFAFHKRSDDGSGKGDAFRTGSPVDRVLGVVFEVRKDQVKWLDDAEGKGKGYRVRWLLVRDVIGERLFRARTYIATKSHIDADLRPFAWYKRHVVAGAIYFGLDPAYVAAIDVCEAIEDDRLPRARRELSFPCDADVAATQWRSQRCNGSGPEPCPDNELVPKGTSAESRMIAYLTAKLAGSRGAGTVVEVLTPANIAANLSRRKELQDEFPKLLREGSRGRYIVSALKDLFEDPPLPGLAVYVATCKGATTGAASTFSPQFGPNGEAVPTTQLHWLGGLETPKGTGTALAHRIAMESAGINKRLWLAPTDDARAVLPRLGFIEANGFMYLPQHVVDVIASVP